MDYYRSNALYEYIVDQKLTQFRFAAGNIWQLVYGDNACRPLLLVFAVGVPLAELDNAPSTAELDAFNILSVAGNKAELPLRYIRFATDAAEIETVRVSDNSFIYNSLSMGELSDLFGSFGLPVSNTQTAKYLNDKASSAYHNWQRAGLGAALTVSDIDLWRLNSSGLPETIFELKRSYYDLQRWQPFPDDYRNFMLLSNLCNKANLRFKIIYNQRITTPFEDKTDRLKIFSVDFSKTLPISETGIIMQNELKDI